MSNPPQAGESGEFRRGWPIVLSAFLGVGLGLSPLPFYTIGLLAPRLAKEFGWGMGQVFFGITVYTLVTLVGGPLVGWLATRHGTRPVALGSLVLFALAFMSLALSNGSLPLYYATWVAIALLGAGTLPITWTRGVNAWFERSKGFALGLALAGTGVFGMVAKPLTKWLIDEFGWRGAYVGLGLLPLLVAAPVAWLLFRNVDGDPDKPKVAPDSLPGATLGEALRDRRFWLLACAFLLVSFALGGPVPNMENILKQGGFPPEQVLGLTMFIGLSALVGRLAGGWLIDRFWAPGVGLVILSAPALACWLLSQGGLSQAQALLSICLIGFALGVEYDLMAFLVARYFGMRSYTQIYSLLYVCFAMGAGFAPALFGWAFDRQKSYAEALGAGCVMLVIGALALLGLGRYRHSGRH